jgi:REP element-mobilizing transposase RayT
MARKPRVYYPGAVYHVTLRGNAGQAIFLDNRDRTRFYFLFQEGIERFGHRIHAFCLISNYVHLAIQCQNCEIASLTPEVLALNRIRSMDAAGDGAERG